MSTAPEYLTELGRQASRAQEIEVDVARIRRAVVDLPDPDVRLYRFWFARLGNEQMDPVAEQASAIASELDEVLRDRDVQAINRRASEEPGDSDWTSSA